MWIKKESIKKARLIRFTELFSNPQVKYSLKTKINLLQEKTKNIEINRI